MGNGTTWRRTQYWIGGGAVLLVVFMCIHIYSDEQAERADHFRREFYIFGQLVQGYIMRTDKVPNGPIDNVIDILLRDPLTRDRLVEACPDIVNSRVDCWGHKIAWTLATSDGRIICCISSAGPNGRLDQGDETDDVVVKITSNVGATVANMNGHD
jgi:hypothetical protein